MLSRALPSARVKYLSGESLIVEKILTVLYEISKLANQNLTRKIAKVKTFSHLGSAPTPKDHFLRSPVDGPSGLCQIGARINSVSIRLILGLSKFNFRFTDSTESASFEKDAELSMLKVFACNTVASSFANWLTEKESVTLFICLDCLVLFITLLFTH